MARRFKLRVSRAYNDNTRLRVFVFVLLVAVCTAMILFLPGGGCRAT